MYQVGHRQAKPKHQWLRWLIVALVLVAAAAMLGVYLSHRLKPKTTITQAKPKVSQVKYESTTKHYDEPDFTIDLPVGWQPVPKTPSPYNMYSWQISEKSTNGELITVYEDTIPVNFAVNRVVIIDGQTDRVATKGEASENCSTYTKNVSPTANQVGAPARWQGVDFLCDQANQSRDVIGTSSTDGVNTVLLKSQTTGKAYKFFFTYTNHSINPDYTVFYSVLNSFQLK